MFCPSIYLWYPHFDLYKTLFSSKDSVWVLSCGITIEFAAWAKNVSHYLLPETFYCRRLWTYASNIDKHTITWEDHLYWDWVSVLCDREYPGTTGVSHFEVIVFHKKRLLENKMVVLLFIVVQLVIFLLFTCALFQCHMSVITFRIWQPYCLFNSSFSSQQRQATGLDAWASRVKCPARFVSHLHEICIYIYELFIAFISFVVCSLL